ncbi:MAG: helix-turn-helix domain-containing protein [Bermanella sp.]
MLILTIQTMKKSNYTIALLAYENCLSSSLFSFRDLIAFANEIARHENKPGIDVELVSVDGATVSLAGDISVHTKAVNQVKFDAIVIPGFMFTQQQGLQRFIQDFQKEIKLLKRLHKQNILIAGNCVGAFLLGEAGLLNDKNATTSWLFESRLKRFYPKVKVDTSKVLVEDKNIMTTGAFSSIHELAFYFIKKHLDQSIASKTQNITLTPGVGQNQTKFIDQSFYATTKSPFIEKVESWLTEHLDQRYSLESLSSAMCVTPRTLMRRYKQKTNSTPLAFLHKKRVDKAKELLRTSELNIDCIALQVGYQDTNAFRKVFKRTVGERPVDYRSSFNHHTDHTSLM